MQLCATVEFLFTRAGGGVPDDGALDGVIEFFFRNDPQVYLFVYILNSTRAPREYYADWYNAAKHIKPEILCRIRRLYTHLFWRYAKNLNICRKSNWLFIVIVLYLYIWRNMQFAP